MGDFEDARRGLVAPFDPPRAEDENAASSGSSSPTTSEQQLRIDWRVGELDEGGRLRVG